MLLAFSSDITHFGTEKASFLTHTIILNIVCKRKLVFYLQDVITTQY